MQGDSEPMNDLTVHKYRIGNNDIEYVEMPIGAELLVVGMQSGSIWVWARVDPDPRRTTIRRKLRVAGTGHSHAEGKYVGTVFDNRFVWHVFDLGEW